MAKLRRISLVALLLTTWGLAGADTLQMDRGEGARQASR